MASIKERAAALNLDEKLCVRPQGEPLIAPRGGLQMRRVLSPADEALLQAFPGAQRLTSALLPAHGVSIKSVQSSCAWNSLILHLKASVAVKPRRVHLKSYSDCFLGSEAVDVLEEYTKGLKGPDGRNEEAPPVRVFSRSTDQLHPSCVVGAVGARAPRPKVACVCQTLLDCGVFEAVGTKAFGRDRKQDPFQDSRSALYR